MANKLIIKRTAVQGRIPATTDIDLGELAINTYDGRFFAKKNVDGSQSVVDLKQNDPIRVLGDATSTYSWDQSTYTSNVDVTLNTVNEDVGTYGSNTGNVLTIPIITVDGKGRVTSVSTTTFSAAANLGTMAVQNASNVEITGGSIDGVSIGLGETSYGGFTEIKVDYDGNIIGNLTVGGNITSSGDLTVSGTFYSNDITAASVTVDGDAVITGNLTVQGVQTIVNSTTVSVGDLNIQLAKDATTAAEANGAGLTVTGPATAATLTYASSDNSWNSNKLFKAPSVTVSGAVSAGTLSADTVSGEIQPNSSGDSAGGIVFPANPGGGSLDSASIRYYASTGEKTVLELKVTNDDSSVAGGPDIIKLNASGGTTVVNTLTADQLQSNGLTAGRVTFAGAAGLLVDDADLTFDSTSNTLTVPFLEIGSNAHVVNTLTVDGKAVIGNLTITGTTDLGTLTTTNASSTQVLYAGSAGQLKGEAAFAYNETTNTLSVVNLSGETVALSSAATYTLGTYTTGALHVVGDVSFAASLQVQTDIRAAGAIYKAGNEVLSTVDTIDGGTF